MSDLKFAAKLALEALEYAGKDDFWRYQNEAITALEAALAKQEQGEPVMFQIFKPTPPRLAIPNVRDGELPWVYDQDPSSGNVASMWVTPVKATPQPKKPEQEPVATPQAIYNKICLGLAEAGCKLSEQQKMALASLVQDTAPLQPKKPEQEPVEWGVDWGPDGNSVSIIKRLANGNIEVLAWEYAPHPPQRTWVGLTDEEIADCAEKMEASDPTDSFWREFFRGIEAKLKEKNEL